MMELVVATKNRGKLREIRGLLKDFELKITSLADYPDIPDIIEDGTTFAQNALKKAASIALYTKKLTMGEDSGIEVKALGNRPGIFSARYSGPGANDEKNNAKLLRELRNVPMAQRRARYRCFIALADGKRVIDIINGQCSGVIANKPRGENGFGYDPLFVVARYGKTFGEMDPAIKSRISHRARALRKAKKVLVNYLTGRHSIR